MSQMQQIEQQLRRMILGLELGPGEKLSERWMESLFGASRTPVRAALLRLETEGLVGREGRGWAVSPINLSELEQIAVYREALEVAALRLTCRLEDKSGLETIEAMLDSCEDGTPREEWHRVGMDFHIELARLSGNDYLFRGVRDAMNRLLSERVIWIEAISTVSHSSLGVSIFEAVEALRFDEKATEANLFVHTTYVLLQNHEGWRIAHVHCSEASSVETELSTTQALH